ncbi:MAG: hypothetical protein CMM50_16125 [Rhodospirillaceae bacterium]|nr:hypothetical protein [Rhodospirillaceae bacterium]
MPALFVLITLSWFANDARAERVLATYESLTATLGDNYKCDSSIPVTVRAGDGNAFKGQRLELQKLTGGLVAALGFECPEMEIITITGVVGRAVHFQGSASASDGWRLQGSNLSSSSQAHVSTPESPTSTPKLSTVNSFDSAEEGNFPCQSASISEFEDGAKQEGVAIQQITKAIFEARYNPPVEMIWDVHQAFYACAATALGVHPPGIYDNEIGWPASRAWNMRYGVLPEERAWELAKRLLYDEVENHDSFSRSRRDARAMELVRSLQNDVDAAAYVMSGVPLLSYHSKKHLLEGLGSQRWDEELNLTAKYFALRERFLLKTHSPQRVAELLQREHYIAKTIRYEQQTRETQISRQIEGAQSGDDIFGYTHSLIAPKLRLMYRGEFEALVKMISEEGYAVKNQSGAGLMLGLLGGIMPGVEQMVDQRIEAARYGGLMMQYVFAKMDTIGLCGERAVEFSGGNGPAVVVPLSFADIAESVQIWRVDSSYGPGLQKMITAAGGCSSATLRTLERNMVRFWSWKPGMPEPAELQNTPGETNRGAAGKPGSSKEINPGSAASLAQQDMENDRRFISIRGEEGGYVPEEISDFRDLYLKAAEHLFDNLYATDEVAVREGIELCMKLYRDGISMEALAERLVLKDSSLACGRFFLGYYITNRNDSGVLRAADQYNTHAYNIAKPSMKAFFAQNLVMSYVFQYNLSAALEWMPHAQMKEADQIEEFKAKYWESYPSLWGRTKGEWFCNDLSKNIYMAVAHQRMRRDTGPYDPSTYLNTKGWYEIPPDECRNFAGNFSDEGVMLYFEFNHIFDDTFPINEEYFKGSRKRYGFSGFDDQPKPICVTMVKAFEHDVNTPSSDQKLSQMECPPEAVLVSADLHYNFPKPNGYYELRFGYSDRLFQQRGVMGAEVGAVTYEFAKTKKLRPPRGARLIHLLPGKPAVKAGLKQDDIVLAVNDKEIFYFGEFLRIMASKGAGTKVDLQVYRDGRTIPISVVLASPE